ncbi:MAG: hypothetical protein INR69_19355 [Mucilaginibacter polytrichastri]|nr:hypothetical protein [Mucilaginibacter polytrichastri]
MENSKDTAKPTFQTVVWKENGRYIARCLNVNLVSYGNNKREALESLESVLRKYFQHKNWEEVPEVEQAEIFAFDIEWSPNPDEVSVS